MIDYMFYLEIENQGRRSITLLTQRQNPKARSKGALNVSSDIPKKNSPLDKTEGCDIIKEKNENCRV